MTDDHKNGERFLLGTAASLIVASILIVAFLALYLSCASR